MQIGLWSVDSGSLINQNLCLRDIVLCLTLVPKTHYLIDQLHPITLISAHLGMRYIDQYPKYRPYDLKMLCPSFLGHIIETIPNGYIVQYTQL